jgi:hypothetical protein
LGSYPGPGVWLKFLRQILLQSFEWRRALHSLMGLPPVTVAKFMPHGDIEGSPETSYLALHGVEDHAIGVGVDLGKVASYRAAEDNAMELETFEPASSNPSTISSTTAVTPGTRSSISPGRSWRFEAGKHRRGDDGAEQHEQAKDMAPVLPPTRTPISHPPDVTVSAPRRTLSLFGPMIRGLFLPVIAISRRSSPPRPRASPPVPPTAAQDDRGSLL